MTTPHLCKVCNCEKEAKSFDRHNSGTIRPVCNACQYKANKAKNDKAYATHKRVHSTCPWFDLSYDYEKKPDPYAGSSRYLQGVKVS